MEDKVKRRMIGFLDDTVNHYNLNNRSYFGGSCSYIPLDESCSEGCAIGRKLPKTYKKKLIDSSYNITASVSGLFEYFGVPKYFKGMPVSFLRQVQVLHDEPTHWTSEGLSELGVSYYEKIKTNFNLTDIK